MKNILYLLFFIIFGIQCRKDAEVISPDIAGGPFPFTGVIFDDVCVGYIIVISGQNILRARGIQFDTLYSTWRDSLQNVENPFLKFRIGDTILFNARKPTASESRLPICLSRFPIPGYGQCYITAVKK